MSSAAYTPSAVEAKMYRRWERAKVFRPHSDVEVRPRRRGGLTSRPFVIVIPPPNVTGSLHMGHALQDALMDVLTRYHRMRGDDTLWVPGTDHAGIATQNVVERELKKEGTTRHDLGREKFLERVRAWKEQYGGIINDQIRQLGASCDWSRERFTLDEGYVRAVQEAFIHYARKGLIYRGERIINWCPRCASAISDLEVEHREEDAVLYTIRYGPLKLATVRPETKVGDTGLAVHPEDARYREYVGRELTVESLEGPATIRVVADAAVDPHFGTGVIKVTPGHDFTDFEIGARHGLPTKKVIGEDGRMTADAGPLAGLTVGEARRKAVEILRAKGLLGKEEPYRHSVATCERCGTAVEPLVSKQWFVKMKPLATPAIAAIERDLVRFHPPRWKAVSLDWLRNVKDWCVSRQLWWGHRLPVWYCQTGKPTANSKQRTRNAEPHVVFSATRPRVCPKCGGKDFVQDPDVLDTWFSSALWPFAAFGWPEATADLKRFYPTSVLTTAPEILHLWVARMIFSGLEFMDGKTYLPARRYGKRRIEQRVPFRDVIIHATVLMRTGARMSKSKGISVDPLDLIKRYGADAARFGMLLQLRDDQQAFRFDENAVRAARNFVNKLWNLGRFLAPWERAKGGKRERVLSRSPFDVWILSRLAETTQAVTDGLASYRFGDAARALHDFVWDDFADWYVEVSKVPGMASPAVAHAVFADILRVLHPFAPFVTEKLWETFGDGEALLAVAAGPAPRRRDSQLPTRNSQLVERFQRVVRDLRSARTLLGISPGKKIAVRVTDPALEPLFPAIAVLAGCGSVALAGNRYAELPSLGPVKIAVARADLAGLDLAKRLAAAEQRTRETTERIAALEKRLGGMRGKAPPKAVAEQEQLLHDQQRAFDDQTRAVEGLRALARGA